ncbi:hypothetical protein BH18ACI1_BH18ACI1_17420 [soil metagenome]
MLRLNEAIKYKRKERIFIKDSLFKNHSILFIDYLLFGHLHLG